MGSTRAETSRRGAGRSALISRVGILLAVLVLSGAPIASAAPFADKAALEAAVASCLDPTWNSQTAAAVGDPTGVACCSKPDVDCGAAGTDEMPDWDVSLVTSMSELFMFPVGRDFNADISRWDVSSVTTMKNMFKDADAFNQDIGAWDTSSVRTLRYLFMGAFAFNQDISAWDTSRVTDLYMMFRGTQAFNRDIRSWDMSSATNAMILEDMFGGATAWQARYTNCGAGSSHAACSEVTSYESAVFNGANNGPPAAWVRKDNACDALRPSNGDVGDCTDTLMSGETCTPVCDYGYELRGVTSCTDRVLTRAICAPVFTSRTALKTAVDACLAAVPSGEKCCSTDPHCANALDDPTAPPRCANAGCSDMPEWNTEFVTDMSALFQDAHAFDQDIGNWNTSRVTNMRIMFGAAAKFDGDLSNWDVSSVTDMENMFLNARAFSGGDLSSWNTGKVTKMNGMFADNTHNGASRFNGDLSNWDVSSVTDMSAMFSRAVKFQGKGLSRWDVRGMTSTSNMFNGASVFRGDIMAWDLGSGTSADGMFDGATAWQSVYVDCSAVNCGSDNHEPDCDLCDVAFYGAKFPTLNMASSEWTRRVRKWAPVDHHLHISSSSDSRSAAVSTNGKRIALAADGSQGSVARVYELRDGAWTTQNGSDIAPFSSLHMSAAGNRIVVGPQNCELVCEGHGYGLSECVALVGCQYDDPSSECHSAVGPHPCDSQSGHPHSNAHVTVYGYHAQEDAWLPVGGEDFFGDVNSTMGHDVALSMDGSRVAMSAIKEDDVAGNHTEAGLVRVYEWRRGEWIQLGQDLRGVDHDERFGATVSLSNDGARLVVASGAGFATAYRLDLGSGRWRQMGDAFPGNSATRACISGDGGTVAVGVTDTDPDPGYVEAYRWSESDEAWTQVGERVRKGEGDGTFARTVSLSHDGVTLSVTGMHTWTDDNGAPVDMSYAAVLRWNSFISQWDTRGSSGISMDGYHRHAAVSGDGRVLIAGAGVYALSCDASVPPAGGGRGGDVGDCTASLAPGETCTPTCGLGFDALDATCSETGRLTPGSCASSWCEADVTRGGFATGSAAADDIGCLPECAADNTCIPARYVRVYKSYSGHSSDHNINLAELAVWSSADPDVNLAAGKDVTCSPACSTKPDSDLPHGNQFLVDGAIDSGVFHTCYEGNSVTRGGLDAGSCASGIPKSVEIDLGQEYTIDGMLIVNRLDRNTKFRAEGLMVDFMDADRNVKLTTAPITNAHRLNDGFIMDVQAGIQRNGEGEFDAWSYVPQGSISQSSAFDWRTYRWWCATDEYWDGSACVTCPSGSFSVGGAATLTSCTSCNANEFWDGSACASCPSGSFSAGGAATTTTCTTCTADEYWNGQACATCPGGAVGAVDGTMCATIWYSTANPSDVLIGSHDEVTGWKDATGNGYDIGAGPRETVYGDRSPTLETSTDGKYAVRVGGSSRKYLRSSDSFAALGLADIPQPFTVMAVIKINSGSAYLMDGYLLDKFAIGIDGGDNIYPFPTTDTNPKWRGTGGASLTGNCGFPSAGWGVHEWVFSNTAGETAIYKADGSAPCIDTQDTMSQANSLTGLTIGEDGAMRINIMDADVSWREFMIIPGTLTREESARYREYLDDIAYSLPDLYEAYPGHYCTGRNEVGSFTGSLAECAAMCEASPECISFDFDASNADWTSTAQTDCWLSSTCTKEISDTNNRFTLLIKISAKAAAG